MLDEAEELRRIDPSNVFPTMESTPLRLVPPTDATSTFEVQFEKPRNLVIGGMGGSGIVGDILSDYCRETADIPVSVCRALKIPKFVKEHTLFLAISYSGETAETLGQLEQARKQGASIAAITSGGRLLSLVKKERIPYLKVPSGLLPRIALPEMMAAAVFAAGAAKVLTNTLKLLSSATTSLKDQIQKINPSVPLSRNDAKRMAQALDGKLPLLIGDESKASVLRRFKNELNENAKMPAFYYTLTEGYHDDIEGLRTLGRLASVQPIILRISDEIEGQRRAREELVALLHKLEFPSVTEFHGFGEDRFSELLTAIMFGDYVSVYLAALRGLDPAELTVIPRFRQAMSGR